jgi:hypothetical protein
VHTTRRHVRELSEVTAYIAFARSEGVWVERFTVSTWYGENGDPIGWEVEVESDEPIPDQSRMQVHYGVYRYDVVPGADPFPGGRVLSGW